MSNKENQFMVGDKVEFSLTCYSLGGMEAYNVEGTIRICFGDIAKVRFVCPFTDKVKYMQIPYSKLDNKSRYIKPPLGLTPTKLWMEDREKEISAAIWRYLKAEMEVPVSWIAESYDLKNRLKEMEGMYSKPKPKKVKKKH